VIKLASFFVLPLGGSSSAFALTCRQAVSSNSEGTFSAGNPTPLFQTQLRAPISSTDLFSYDVAKDGQRFLVSRYVKPEQVAPLRIVLNSTAGLVK
jgi:hypothetical protein